MPSTRLYAVTPSAATVSPVFASAMPATPCWPATRPLLPASWPTLPTTCRPMAAAFTGVQRSQPALATAPVRGRVGLGGRGVQATALASVPPNQAARPTSCSERDRVLRLMGALLSSGQVTVRYPGPRAMRRCPAATRRSRGIHPGVVPRLVDVGRWRRPDRASASLVLTPAVVAHRGASGHRPEHTLEAYRTAIRMGADDIELDLVSTRDGVLVARHERELGGPPTWPRTRSSPTCARTRTSTASSTTGWFVEDLTLAELKPLDRPRADAARPRPASAAYDGTEGVPTFNEVLAMVGAESARRGRTVGVMVELKHAAHHDVRRAAAGRAAAGRPGAATASTTRGRGSP